MFHFRFISHDQMRGCSPTEMLLQAWSMDNVNAGTLRDTLIEAELIRAAEVLTELFDGTLSSPFFISQ